MMLGDWVNDLDPNDLLEIFVTKAGVGTVRNNNKILDGGVDDLPSNRMYDYDPKTTIMTFRFDEGYQENELPKYFVDSKGIIEGESNCELIYEFTIPSTKATIGCVNEVKQPPIPKLYITKN